MFLQMLSAVETLVDVSLFNNTSIANTQYGVHNRYMNTY